MSRIESVLVANRGEIARRIFRTLRSMGIRSVAMYSPVEADSLFTREADVALEISGMSPSEIYLSAETIIDAAKKTGANSIHPGYGFLSENPEFSQACSDAGLIWIGPSPKSIALMGSKISAKRCVQNKAVPCVPGYEGSFDDLSVVRDAAADIGYPVLLKAAFGGGGRGMRKIEHDGDLADGVKRAQSEAKVGFGSDELLLEKFIETGRHIEIQVFADSYGNTIYLGERECSLQRRHQKVVEEAPSPAVSDELRQRMGKAAVDAAKACEYCGAGTVEFLVSDNDFYFLEMNTRIQVEHPVTEAITGIDLVEWQIRIAQGEPLPLGQDDVEYSGHAIEVRLYAEQPEKDFLPSTGVIANWDIPMVEGVRYDHAIESKARVTSFFDPMIAKIIAWGPTRNVARTRLLKAVEGVKLYGIGSNQGYLARIIRDPDFIDGLFNIHFLAERHHVFARRDRRLSTVALMATLGKYLVVGERYTCSELGDWTSMGSREFYGSWKINEEIFDVAFSFSGREGNVRIGDSHFNFAIVCHQEDTTLCRFDDALVEFQSFADKERWSIKVEAEVYECLDLTAIPKISPEDGAQSRIRAVIDGRIAALNVSVGSEVTQGDVVAVIEAMKIEHPIRASRDGILEEIMVAIGEQVAQGQHLMIFSAEDGYL
ncbi:MAG: biotin carboxylase N-terminal domain-containing protein [Myxococcota bacterium]|nr:biotin carboxylase N-terminal domain-containing protein [Myxococcota bacterium]